MLTMDLTIARVNRAFELRLSAQLVYCGASSQLPGLCEQYRLRLALGQQSTRWQSSKKQHTSLALQRRVPVLRELLQLAEDIANKVTKAIVGSARKPLRRRDPVPKVLLQLAEDITTREPKVIIKSAPLALQSFVPVIGPLGAVQVAHVLAARHELDVAVAQQARPLLGLDAWRPRHRLARPHLQCTVTRYRH